MTASNSSNLLIPRLQKYSLITLFILTPLIFYRGTEEAFLLIKTVVAEVCLFVFMVATVYNALFKGKGRSCIFTGSILVILLLVGYTVSSIFTASYQLPGDLGMLPTLQFGSDYFHLAFFILAFLLLTTWEREPGVNNTILHVMVVVAAVTAGYGLLQYVGADPLKSLWIHESVVKQRGIFSTFGNANMLSGYLVTLLPFLFLWFFREDDWVKKYFYGFLILIFSMTVVVTGTRGAWTGGFLSLSILFIFIVKRNYITRRTFFISLSILVLIVVLLSFMVALTNLYHDDAGETLFWKRVWSFFDTGDVSGRARLIAWDISLRMIAAQPWVGTSIGNFKRQFLYHRADFFKTKDRVDYVPIVGALYYTRTHNEYLQTIVEGGIVAAIPLYLLVIFFLYAGIRNLMFVADEHFSQVIGAYCGLIGMAFHAIFSFPYHLATHGILLIYLGSFFMPLLRWRGPIPARQPWSSIDTIALLGVISILIMSLGFMIKDGARTPFASFFADIKTKQARKSFQAQPPDPQKTLQLCRQGLEKNPAYGPLYFYQAQAHQLLARFYKGKRDMKQARTHYLQSIESCKKGILYRTDAALYVLWGLNEQEVGNIKQAYKVLKIAVYLDPSNFNYLRLAGIVAYQMGKMDEALIHLQHSRGFFDEDPVVHQIMAAIQQQKGKVEEAVIHLDKLWGMRDKLKSYRISDLNIALNFADVHRVFKNYDLSLSVLDEIAKKYPGNQQIETLREKVSQEFRP